MFPRYFFDSIVEIDVRTSSCIALGRIFGQKGSTALIKVEQRMKSATSDTDKSLYVSSTVNVIKNVHVLEIEYLCVCSLVHENTYSAFLDALQRKKSASCN